MRIYEGIGLIVYLIIIGIILYRQFSMPKKIDETLYHKKTRQNLILLTIVVILLLLFLYTPFKLLII